ncbi:EamA family transporter RarD [Macrococcus armenti]|uniref:EamA family transporter RarD n=1 Tax=Macrococcus armenti TaxID=2875764 RepID=UPI001CCBA419|nr:EamA family transporter RarD [Macrococcus armenti]UBH15744.1 EamA family transporter RarD [Macrococcus armenti]UBH18103.1 EamA family transporter RarD [Macrococcus armenti]UBH20370.1 EamA family transporter RarD [Macrococcus armenti]
MDNSQKGVLYTASAYLLWGILPSYWRAVGSFNDYEILFHRIVWSFVFMVILLAFTKKLSPLIQETKALYTRKREFIALIVASLVITVNWGIFIWAVNNHHVLQASLGYYINPLMSIALGFIFLKERFTKTETIAIALATLGVLYMTITIGTFPIVSIALALSFALYGLMKKVVNINAVYSIALETLITLPIACLGIALLTSQHKTYFGMNFESFLILFAGVATAIPLILFSAGAKRIPLSLIGLLQYISPTLILLQGVFMFSEPFTTTNAITFICIWSGLAIYSFSKWMGYKKRHNGKKIET